MLVQAPHQGKEKKNFSSGPSAVFFREDESKAGRDSSKLLLGRDFLQFSRAKAPFPTLCGVFLLDSAIENPEAGRRAGRSRLTQETGKAVRAFRQVSPLVGGTANLSLRNSPVLAAPAVPAQGGSLLDRVGNTPLLALPRTGRAFPHIGFYAKAEWFNPGGSVKDRAALRMISEGERSGRLRPGKTIVDATSGNTGIAYAMIGAAKGYRVKLCVPESASEERKRILKAYSVEVIFTPAGEGSDGAIRRARAIYAADPERYFYPDQYGNPANWRAHYETTAQEIWAQTGGHVTHFVAGLGTSGTFIGVARRLKELNPSLRASSVQPDSAFHGLEGLKHMPTAIVPAIYDPALADENLWVRTEAAYEMVRRLAREEGLLIGPSSGAALCGCFRVAERIPADQPAVIVTVFPDSGDKYLSERFWEEG
jgi:S-sulfo-L-cysteine synthase (O-acetyl-L-serine-dependent)